jgi:magnesium chelatase subunit D
MNAVGASPPVAPSPTEEAPDDSAWADAAWAAALLAVDPPGLGGVWVRAGAGPVRERWTAQLAHLLPPDTPVRRLPTHIADDRLLGGLDLAATLHAGRPVAQRGLLAEADGGVVLVPMAERLGPGTAARLAAALDERAVGFERDGVSRRWPSRLAVVALDEGQGEDPPPPASLTDRLALRADLGSLALRQTGEPAATPVAVALARERLAAVEVPESILRALCAAALQLGVDSLRASVAAVRAARAAAALAGRLEADEDDARLAVRLELGPRATRMPADASQAPQAQPPEATPPPPAAPENNESTSDADPPEAAALEELLVAAAQAAISERWLAALRSRERAQAAGRVGELSATPRGGRPVGSRAGMPRGGARLSLMDTLRAAAPWQPLRRREPAGQASTAVQVAALVAPPTRNPTLRVHASDLRVSRLQQRAATATVFVIDASGSSALHRLAEAKGAINLLLADCYVRRDQVGVIAFRGTRAEVLLEPTRSLVRARRSLAALPGGGGTPLASALEAALRMAGQVRRGGSAPVLVLLTDGRANIARNGEPGRAAAEADALAAARLLRAQSLTSLLVDTSPQPAQAARRLATEMGAVYRALPYAGAAELSAAVKALPRPGP